ncbi:MAG: hypothetical protein IKH26_10730 [Bacteroidaceae bacterium]|nr:hypothetical protein [Bacteroidaceae bacterium]
MTGSKKNPYVWIPVLFSAEAIPMAIVTFVAILMFIQSGTPNSHSTFYCALLLIPWAIKSFFRQMVQRFGRPAAFLRSVEMLIFGCLIALAFYMNRLEVNPMLLFAFLFILSSLCVWHSLLAEIYYRKRLMKKERSFFLPALTSSYQVSTVVTYGLFIILVGGLEVFFKNLENQYNVAWSMGTYILTGIFFIIMVLNFMLLTDSIQTNSTTTSLTETTLSEAKHIKSMTRTKRFTTILIALMLLVLPQSLMFFVRVFFLYTPLRNGGLGCSMQEIGFAQGTIGVMAFSLGIILGRQLLHKHLCPSTLWAQAISLTLSPLFYFIMTTRHPNGIAELCVMTFLSQICFGFGFNCCMPLVKMLSHERYKLATNYLQIPVLVTAMIPPLAISGLMVSRMGFHNFFFIDCLTAPVVWIFLLATGTITLCAKQATPSP